MGALGGGQPSLPALLSARACVSRPFLLAFADAALALLLAFVSLFSSTPALLLSPCCSLLLAGMCLTSFVYQGNLTTAVAYYREAIRLCPGFADAHSNLGNVLKVGPCVNILCTLSASCS